MATTDRERPSGRKRGDRSRSSRGPRRAPPGARPEADAPLEPGLFREEAAREPRPVDDAPAALDAEPELERLKFREELETDRLAGANRAVRAPDEPEHFHEEELRGEFLDEEEQAEEEDRRHEPDEED